MKERKKLVIALFITIVIQMVTVDIINEFTKPLYSFMIITAIFFPIYYIDFKIFRKS